MCMCVCNVFTGCCTPIFSHHTATTPFCADSTIDMNASITHTHTHQRAGKMKENRPTVDNFRRNKMAGQSLTLR